jgi:hypothetical protein
MVAGGVRARAKSIKKVIANAAEIVILTSVIRRLTTSKQRYYIRRLE